MPTLRKFLEKINIAAAIEYEAPLAARTSFKIGGPAEALVAPKDREGFGALVQAAKDEGIPVFILGGGANLLVGDRGIRGLVLETRLLDAVEEGRSPEGQALLRAGAGLAVDRLCEAALARGLGGLETFYGMPGSVGGAVFMNARCYEVEVADRLFSAEYLEPTGELRELAALPADWAYKRSPFQAGGRATGGLILGASFRLEPASPDAIEGVMREKRADREAKGHYRLPSAGSVFKNNRSFGRPTGKILDELGFRGRRIGGAQVSEWHANIFVNAGGATARDMRGLIELAQAEARARLGLELEPEVIFVGDF